MLPASHATRAVLDREELLRAVRPAALIAHESANIVKLGVGLDGDPGITVSANAEVGDHVGRVEAAVEGDGTTIAFNARFLADVLTNVDAEQFALELNGPLSPGVFKPLGDDRYVHVVMPLRTDFLTVPSAVDAVARPRIPRRARRRSRSRTSAATLGRAAFGPGPQLVVGPNAAGKTSLLEAIVLLAWGRSHRTSTDARARPVGRRRRPRRGPRRAARRSRSRSSGSGEGGGGARKRIRVNGVARRAAGLVGLLRTVALRPRGDAPRRRLAGSPPRGDRPARDPALAGLRSATSRPTPGRSSSGTASSGRSARSRRRATELRFWDDSFLESGGGDRRRAAAAARRPRRAARARPTPRSRPRRPARHPLAIRYATNAPALPGESPRDALARRLVETAEKEVWNGSTLIGPHRDDLVFELDGRDLAGFASRGQQRTAILAFKLAELDLLTAQDGRPPLLLLDDVFSELDPERRSHLVRRIAELPQAS